MMLLMPVDVYNIEPQIATRAHSHHSTWLTNHVNSEPRSFISLSLFLFSKLTIQQNYF